MCALSLAKQLSPTALALRNFSEECARIPWKSHSLCVRECVCVFVYSGIFGHRWRWLRHIVRLCLCVFCCVPFHDCQCVRMCDCKRHRNQLQSFPFDHISSVLRIQSNGKQRCTHRHRRVGVFSSSTASSSSSLCR